jgi:hypothetical protein
VYFCSDRLTRRPERGSVMTDFAEPTGRLFPQVPEVIRSDVLDNYHSGVSLESEGG